MSPFEIPPIQDIQDIHFPSFVVETLEGGLTGIVLKKEDAGVVRIDTLYRAGRYYEQGKMHATATAALMLDGTTGWTSAQIADRIEMLGASIRYRSGMDFCRSTLMVSSKNALELLKIWSESLEEATFPADELEKYKVRNKESLHMDLSNNDIVAHREFTEMLYGTDHSYGYNRNDEIIDSLQVEDLKKHHSAMQSGFQGFYMNGAIDDHIIAAINDVIDRHDQQPIVKLPETITSTSDKERFIQVGRSIQSSIRIGCVLPPMSQSDTMAFMILNVVVGGYFGSRLIARIREELGYTYGIYSSIDRYVHSAYWSVSTEVGVAHKEDTMREIQEQFLRLQTDLIPSEELDMVRNYMLGNIMMRFNGLDKSLNALIRMYSRGDSMQDVQRFIQYIKGVTPEILREVAKKYLQWNRMSVVIVE